MIRKRLVCWIISIAVIVSLWELCAFFMKAPLILPSPAAVFQITLSLLFEKAFWLSFLFSFIRILLGFLISAVLGIAIGFLCGNYKTAEYLFEIPVAVLRTVPVIAFILFVIYWFNSSVVPVFVCVMMSFPIMTSSVISGFGNVDSKLLEMSENFNFTKLQTFRYVKIPSVIPYIKNGLIQTFGLCWKVTIAGEVLCLPKNGLGSKLQINQIHLETGTVMAITVLLVIFCFAFEKLFGLLMKKLFGGNK